MTYPVYHMSSLFDKAVKTATGNGAAVKLGASDKIVAVLDVLAASGTSPTLDVKIQESADGSTWSDLITFTQKTGVGREEKSAVPDNAKPYKRVSYTIGGTNPSFTFDVAEVSGLKY
jgi:hypothetical protein